MSKRVLVIIITILFFASAVVARAAASAKPVKSELIKTQENFIKFIDAHPVYSEKVLKSYLAFYTKRKAKELNLEQIKSAKSSKKLSKDDLQMAWSFMSYMVKSLKNVKFDYVIQHNNTGCIYYSKENVYPDKDNIKGQQRGFELFKKESGKWKIDGNVDIENMILGGAKDCQKDKQGRCKKEEYLPKFDSKNNPANEKDSDKDGLSDDYEKDFGTNPKKADTDGDKHNDYTEILNCYDPLQKNK